MSDERLVIEKSKVIRTTREQLFSALTEPHEIVRYLPFKSVESDGCEGGSIIFRGDSNGTPFEDIGVIEVLSPPEVFQYRYWSTNHRTAQLAENHLRIRYTLREDGPNVVLNVSHSDIPPGPYHAVMTDVWEQVLQALKGHVER
ncbi:SRPBCC domain-containing protein [Sphingomonas sp. HDW15A]|uniref:SRPBCC family protein n=1 Tax=Sphingomonas sp. HDW15A TaxID=2714942 RepID=UPI00140D4B63|nr:SRPBCC family protein [Sphingomonas sp. HDW15A]QIK95402.1 SRPBCC domain-containing protein [Sphingomonas sp. HDW15A]